MRRLLLQAIFLTFGLIANLYIVGDVSAELVCGALLAICCAAVGEYARSSAWTIAILLMLDCGACFTPSWCAMMPVAAYNAAMLPAISQNVEQPRAGRNHAGLRSQLPNMPQYDAMQITTVIARWVWIIPVVATLVRCRNAGAHADDMGAALIAVLLALHVVLGFMVGLLCARNVTLTRQNRRLQDSKRDQIRRLRSQLAESEEDRAASVRVATLAERTRIAREIHDNVGHMLTRAIMQSEAAQVVAQVSGQEQAAQGFAQIHDTVGEANEEAGFQAAHAIINGEYDDAIGGGICQVATTVFNAVYEAGYPVTERRNHSLYISSYPTGRDAAIAYPDLDLTWVNDGTSDVLMRSRYTDSSLTVTLYGIDPGYVVSTQAGDWETGEPFKKRTKVDESEPEGTRYVKTAGADGRSVTVHRTVRDRAGNVLHEEDFTSNYAPIDEVTVVGPNTPTREREDTDKEATDKEEASVLSTGD